MQPRYHTSSTEQQLSAAPLFWRLLDLCRDFSSKPNSLLIENIFEGKQKCCRKDTLGDLRSNTYECQLLGSAG